MSETKKLLVGVVFVFIALFMLLTSVKGVLPYVGALLGIIGAILIIRSIFRTGIKP